jgi:hypothetical protein
MRFFITLTIVAAITVTVGWFVNAPGVSRSLLTRSHTAAETLQMVKSDQSPLDLYRAWDPGLGTVWYASQEECEAAAAGIVAYNGSTPAWMKEPPRFNYGLRDPWGGDGLVPHGLWC